MECQRILICTSGGSMKVIRKDSEDYAEIKKDQVKNSNAWQYKVFSNRFDWGIKRFGSIPAYEKWLVKKEETERQNRLFKKYPKWKVYRILSVERAWKQYNRTGDFSQLHGRIKERVDYWADCYAKEYSDFWFSREDFESIFWTTVWQTASRQYYSSSGYYFYESINQKLRDRGTDILRMKLGTKQGYFEHNVLFYGFLIGLMKNTPVH